MPTASATLTDAQIAGYARAANLPESKIPTAVAIARAESRGNTRAHNAVPPDNSYGLWQINMLGTLGPARRKALGISSNDALYDPAVNARAMVMISNNGSNWRPWTTFTSGSYRQYLTTAPGKSAPLDPVETKRLIEEAAAETKAKMDPTGIASKLGQLTETFRRMSWNWLIILIAVVLLILGIVILNRGNIRKGAKTAVKLASVVK